jgi:predicted nucleotidyltransferase
MTTLPPGDPIADALGYAREELAVIYGERLAGVLLYGSHARGEAHEESDVDVLVLLDGEVDVYAEIKRQSALAMEVLVRFGVDVSLHPRSAADYARQQTPFLKEVSSYAVAL